MFWKHTCEMDNSMTISGSKSCEVCESLWNLYNGNDLPSWWRIRERRKTDVHIHMIHGTLQNTQHDKHKYLQMNK